MSIADYISKIRQQLGTISPHCQTCGSTYRTLCWYSYQPGIRAYRCMSCGHIGPDSEWEDA